MGVKNYLTWKQADFGVLEDLKLAENDIPVAWRQIQLTNFVMKLYGLLDGINDPWFNKPAALTVAADQEFLKDSTTNGGTITAINSAGKTITRNAGVFVAGSLVDVAIITKATGLVAFQWKGRIVGGGVVGVYTVISGSDGTFVGATDVATVNVTKTLSTTSVDLSGLYVKDIIQVYDNAGAAGINRLFNLLTDARVFRNSKRNPHYDKAINAFHNGATLELMAGPNATALGNVLMDYRGKPNVYTDATENDAIEMPPEQNGLIIDQYTIACMKKKNMKVPAALESRVAAALQKLYDAAGADMAKQEAVKNQRSK